MQIQIKTRKSSSGMPGLRRRDLNACGSRRRIGCVCQGQVRTSMSSRRPQHPDLLPKFEDESLKTAMVCPNSQSGCTSKSGIFVLSFCTSVNDIFQLNKHDFGIVKGLEKILFPVRTSDSILVSRNLLLIGTILLFVLPNFSCIENSTTAYRHATEPQQHLEQAQNGPIQCT
jgi:hypothetical protein